MKKGLSFAAASALAVSAIAVVAPTADAAATVAKPGFYDGTDNKYYSVTEFQKLSTSQKAALLIKPNVFLYTGTHVVTAENAVNAKTNAELVLTPAAQFTAIDLDAIYNGGTNGEAPIGDLKVESVSAINPTKFEIKFNQEVDKASATNPNNYYFGIDKSKVDNSIGELEGTTPGAKLNDFSTKFAITLADDKKTVYIEAIDVAAASIWNDVNNVSSTPLAIDFDGTNAINIVKNKNAVVQVRNVKNAAGQLMSTQERAFIATDKTPATLYGTKVVDSDLVSSENNTTEHIVTTNADTYFVFDEPVDITNVEFYLDGKNITSISDGSGGTIPGVVLDTTDKTGKTLKVVKEVGLKDLKLGKHEFKAVGVQDLAGNTVTGNVNVAILNVVDPAENPDEAPTVKKVEQISEGKFVVTFAKAPLNGTVINVKDSQGNTVVTKSTTGADATEEVEFATALADYGTSTELHYTVEVVSATGGKIEPATGSAKADKYSKVHVFKLDRTAPTVVRSTTDAKGKVTETVFNNAGKIVIPFADALFNGAVKLNTTPPAQDVVVKQHLNGETKTLTIPFTDIVALVTNKLTLDIVDLKANGSTQTVKDAAAALLNEAGTALEAADYEVILPRGLVTDDEALKLATAVLVPFAGDNVRFTVKKGAGDASVPQTAAGLVDYDPNQKAITVEFKGADIDAATAKNPANYTLAGKVLASDTKIEYQTVKSGNAVTGGIATIFLKQDTIELKGNYSLKVENVATSKGAKMLPVTVTVPGLEDNTTPKLSKAVITGDAKLELTFTESVTINDAAAAAGNFIVLVNNERYQAKSATVQADTKLVVLELQETIQYTGKTIDVETKVDANSDIHVFDLSGNKLNAGTKVRATVKGQ